MQLWEYTRTHHKHSLRAPSGTLNGASTSVEGSYNKRSERLANARRHIVDVDALLSASIYLDLIVEGFSTTTSSDTLALTRAHLNKCETLMELWQAFRQVGADAILFGMFHFANHSVDKKQCLDV